MPSLSNHSFRKPKLFTLLDHLRQRYSTHLQTRMPQQLCHCLFLRIWMFLKKVLNRKQSFRVMKNKLVILFERTAIKLKLMTSIIRLPIVNSKYIPNHSEFFIFIWFLPKFNKKTITYSQNSIIYHYTSNFFLNQG